MADALFTIFVSVFSTVGVFFTIFYISKAVSDLVVKWKNLQAKTDVKIKELVECIEKSAKTRDSIVTRISDVEQDMKNRIQRIEDALDIDMRERDFNRIKRIEHRLDDMANDIAKQIVRIDEIEGRLNG